MDIFAYGSLMEPKILRSLIGRVPKMQKATLYGFYLVHHGIKKFRKYPVAVPKRNSKVIGKLLLNINQKEFAKIHKYEQTPERIWGLKRAIVSVGHKKLGVFSYLANRKFYS